jgi:protein phosphatase
VQGIGGGVKLASWSATHSGGALLSNEDALFADDARGLYLVSDGVGRHRGAAHASRLAVQTMERALGARPARTRVRRWLTDALRHACEKLSDEARANPALVDMAATLTLLESDGVDYTFLQIGDSRGYLCRKGQIAQVTHDHSLAYEQYQAGALTREQVRRHPNQKLLTRTLSASRRLAVPDFFAGTVQSGDVFLLCSDGLTKELSDSEILATLSLGHEPRAMGEAMLRQALDRDPDDNVTLIVVVAE